MKSPFHFIVRSPPWKNCCHKQLSAMQGGQASTECNAGWAHFVVDLPFLQVVLPLDLLVYHVILHLRHSKSVQLPIHLSEVDRE